MNEFFINEGETETFNDEAYWEDPYEDYIDELESEDHSEMYYDFNDDDRPDWLY